MPDKRRQLDGKRAAARDTAGEPTIRSSRLATRHANGKLSARERVELLLDEGSFEEWGLLVEHQATDFGLSGRKIPGDGVITGGGTIDGRPVFLFSQDATIFGGSVGAAHAHKIASVIERAIDAGAPLIGLNEGGGARIQEGVDALAGYGAIFRRHVQASGWIPQLSAIMGGCAGGAAYSPALTDITLMVRDACMFLTGPDVVRAVTGEDVSREALGGAEIHSEMTGSVDQVLDHDIDLLDELRAILNYLPSNAGELPPRLACTDPVDRSEPLLDRVIPAEATRAYDMRRVIDAIADRGSFHELKARFAPNVMTGFIRLDGMPVGVVANQPMVLAGCFDRTASVKAARFIRLCDCFNLPVITFLDAPGFLPGIDQEHGGIVKDGAKLLFAYAEATIPRITVITRKAYGGAYVVASKPVGVDLVLAWPSAEIAVLGRRGAAEILFGGADPAILAEHQTALDRFESPYPAAERFDVDDVIAPGETRFRLIRALALLGRARPLSGSRHHSNFPL